MKSYPWLSFHFKKLISNYYAGLGHQALLIHAASGMGKDGLVFAINKFLICKNPEEHKSCEKCNSCQLMNAKSHPDYYRVEPDIDKGSIGIEIVREIDEKIHKHAHLGGNKVVWIKNATKLTESAENALLKTLEEPLEKTWFFLSCCEPNRLLATLRSRCRIYYLSIPDENLALNWLANKVKRFPEERLSALRISSGAPIAALELLQPNIWSQREQLCKSLGIALKTKNWFSLLKILNHEQVLRRLRWLGSLFLDVMKLRFGATLISNVDEFSLLNVLANRFSDNALQATLHDI